MRSVADITPLAMTPAFRLLVACCRWPENERRRAAVCAAACEVTDWEGFAALADRHRVEPLVANGLAASGIAVPSAILAAVDAARSATMRDLGETLRIAEALDAAGIAHRLLKGIPLGVAAYRSATVKRSWDIDLLVLPGDAVAAADCLYRLDYSPALPPRPLDGQEFDRWSIVSKEAEFRSPHGSTVELHWRVSDHPALLPSIDAETASRAVAIFGDRRVLALADGPTLAYLAVHGSGHGWFRLKWIADFNAFLESMEAPLKATAIAEATRLGVGHALSTAIDLSGQLFRDEAPATDAATRRLTRLSLAALNTDDARDSAARASRARWLLGSGAGFLLSELRIRLRGSIDRLEHPLPGRWAALYPWLRGPFWVQRHVFAVERKRRG